MFNSGVFLATSEAVGKIRRDSIEFTYPLFNEWQRIDALESILPTIKKTNKFLYRYKVLKHLFRHKVPTRQDIVEKWPMEQGAPALSCIKSGGKVRYLDDIYSTWGETDDFRILRCFKSLYPFDRRVMYEKDSEE